MLSFFSAKFLISGALFVVLFAAERLRPAAPPPAVGGKRVLKNASLWGIVIVVSPLILTPVAAWAANDLLWSRPVTWSNNPAALAADIVILDLWTYFLHRAYHTVPALWRFHQVHHRDEFLDTTSAVRFHAGEVIISALVRVLPIALLATPVAHVLVFEVALLCATFFHHSNVRLPRKFEAGVASVFVTPSIHWVHHHAVSADTNSNYGAIFSFWDSLFATRSATRRMQNMKIGVEGVEDLSLLGLLLLPFRGARS